MAKRNKFRNKPQKPAEVFPITKIDEQANDNLKRVPNHIKSPDKFKDQASDKTVAQDELKPVERFDKAFAISLGLIALLSLTFFIPIVGPIMGLTFIPYLACNLGCRYVQRSNGIQVGLLVGVLWSIIELYVLFQILTIVKISVAEPGIYTSLDLIIIVFIFVFNIVFCMIGGYTGGSKFKIMWDKKIKKVNLKHISV